jgi:small subunit ribosomal protein S29
VSQTENIYIVHASNNRLAQDFVIANSSYAPLAGSNPTQYVQDQLTSALLLRTVLANEQILTNLHVSMEHPELKNLRPKMTLNDLARLGVQDTALSWPVFQAFWAELNATTGPEGFQARPPVLVSVDGIGHWMQESKYRNRDFNLIHAHDLALPKHLISLLQPSSSNQKVLPNGGLVLYATSASNKPSLPSFEMALLQLTARQNGQSESSPEYPRPDPYDVVDQRVLDLFRNTTSQQQQQSALELQTLGGLSRDEARGYMEYFARSGILQEKVSEDWVGEKWSLAGGGIVAEMEKLGSRLRTAL